MDLFGDDMFDVFKDSSSSRKRKIESEDGDGDAKMDPEQLPKKSRPNPDEMDVGNDSAPASEPASAPASVPASAENSEAQPQGQGSTDPVQEKASKMEAEDFPPAPEKNEKSEKRGKDMDPKGHSDATGHDDDAGLQIPVSDFKSDFSKFEPQTVSKVEEVGCVHEICFPPNWDTEKIREEMKDTPIIRKPAKQYPFKLDSFQNASIEALERNHSVLVAAHTSAGKTTVAEYAIALALKSGSRVVYTSPIKALSNQKYRELHEEFSDVGLMTGDTTVNPRSSCLVMTTEILRNMLYRGSEVIKEATWIIFDEIHYMRDRERGVVWEECIILLPTSARFVFLSATIPNASQFACWISKLNEHPCHVVYTEQRPTPLQHYMFPDGGKGLYMVVDQKGKFRESNFQKGIAQISITPERARATRKGAKRDTSDIFRITEMIMKKHYDPVIVFSFKKRECESFAQHMSKLDFSSEEDKKLIKQVFNNAVNLLAEEDQRLPQVLSLLPLLMRGIGIHHSGLLPILKETTEILFQEGLVKCLFATETFSMGVNMPAKTVVFSECRKFDGIDFRYISPGEYVQMSGRAGRRGIDQRGICILMVKEKLEPHVIKNMFKGNPDILNSSFHLGYNMLLNMMRVEEADPEYMIQRSFHQFQATGSVPKMEEKLKSIQKESDELKIDNEKEASEYFDLKAQLEKLRMKSREVITLPEHILPFLNPGRLVKIKEKEKDWGWGAIVSFQNIDARKRVGSVAKDLPGPDPSKFYVVDILLLCAPHQSTPKPCPKTRRKEGVWQVVSCQVGSIEKLSTIRIYLQKELRFFKNRKSAGQAIVDVRQKHRESVPCLDPVDDMKIRDKKFSKLLRKIETVENRTHSHSFAKNKNLKEISELYTKKINLQAQVERLKSDMKAIHSNQIIKKHFKSMKRVLRRLGFLNKDNVVDIKGRVACDISTGDELLTTELLFGGNLNELEPAQIVALCSCLVYTEKSNEMLRLKDELGGPYRKMKETAKRIGTIAQESGIEIDVTDYVESFKPDMMDIVYAWCKGAKFHQISKMTNIYEGSIIRVMRRLEELLCQLITACRVIGNTDLEDKLKQGQESIKRDIVFAASLYL